jgi:hypothetical protein
MKMTLTVNSPKGLPVLKAIEWAEQLKQAGIDDDGEKMFVLIFQIWKEAQKPFTNKSQKGWIDEPHGREHEDRGLA